jgi:hypothetical protein
MRLLCLIQFLNNELFDEWQPKDMYHRKEMD